MNLEEKILFSKFPFDELKRQIGIRHVEAYSHLNEIYLQMIESTKKSLANYMDHSRRNQTVR